MIKNWILQTLQVKFIFSRTYLCFFPLKQGSPFTEHQAKRKDVNGPWRAGIDFLIFRTVSKEQPSPQAMGEKGAKEQDQVNCSLRRKSLMVPGVHYSCSHLLWKGWGRIFYWKEHSLHRLECKLYLAELLGNCVTTLDIYFTFLSLGLSPKWW